MTNTDTVNSRPPKAKVYAREIVQAFKELEAIQPPPGFAEYQQRVNRADKKLEDACKRHEIDSLRFIMDFRSETSAASSGKLAALAPAQELRPSGRVASQLSADVVRLASWRAL
jgi:hypothetical protein